MIHNLEKKIVEKFERTQDSLVLQSSDLSLETIARMVKGGSIDIAPHYQRRERWKIDAKSALIESFLINIPVPPVYLAEDDFGTYSVIDGKQRITTIAQYLQDEFALKNLQRFTELEGCKFSGLPKPLKNALSIRPYIRVVTLLKQSSPELKYEVFTRLNTGGSPLLPQEIRNALYRGDFNDLLFELSNNQFLRQQLKIKNETESAHTEMTDVEMALRFFTMKDSWEDFSGDYRRSMDEYMNKHQYAKTTQLDMLKKSFNSTIARCSDLWGNIAFKRYDKGVFRDQFLAAMFDAQMIAISSLTSTQFNKLKLNKSKVTKKTQELFKNTKFVEAVRVSTNTPSRVHYRVNCMIDLLQSI